MRTTERKRSLLHLVGKWVAELVLVFIGAYAAFALNAFQQHQQDAKRHDQILASLEQYVEVIVTQSQKNAAAQEARVAEFKRALAAGEMPPIRPITWTTDYSPTDVGNFLQAGGLDLLDVRTLAALRNADSVTRSGLNDALHDQKLSDELIVPNLAKGPSAFYDPATRQLKEPFTGYPGTLESYGRFYHRTADAYGELLKAIRAERQRSH